MIAKDIVEGIGLPGRGHFERVAQEILPDVVDGAQPDEMRAELDGRVIAIDRLVDDIEGALAGRQRPEEPSRRADGRAARRAPDEPRV